MTENKSNHTILVVDDSAVIRSMVTEIVNDSVINPYSINIIGINTVELAVRHLKVKPVSFIYLDVILAGLDGINLMQLMATNPEWIRPTLVMSGDDKNFEKVRTKVPPPNYWYGFITKPFDKTSLVKATRAVMNSYKGIG